MEYIAKCHYCGKRVSAAVRTTPKRGDVKVKLHSHACRYGKSHGWPIPGSLTHKD